MQRLKVLNHDVLAQFICTTEADDRWISLLFP